MNKLIVLGLMKVVFKLKVSHTKSRSTNLDIFLGFIVIQMMKVLQKIGYHSGE